MSSSNPRLLVVGAGITGAATSRLLQSSGISVAVWEKARGSGGRMSTSRANCDSRMHTDLGAQYITVGAGGGQDKELASTALAYDALIARGLLTRIDPASIAGGRGGHEAQVHYVAPAGLSSVVKDLLAENPTVSYGRQLASLSRTTGSESQPLWQAVDSDGLSEMFDAVVLTIPAPQVLELGGDLPALLAAEVPQLPRVQYSSRYAMGLYYPPEAWPVLAALPWAARYVNKAEDDVLVFVSCDSRKRGFSEEAAGPGPVVMLHSSVPWGLQHLEADPDWVGSVMQERLAKFIPGLMPPRETKVLRWRYSQVRPGTEAGVDGLSALLVEAQGQAPLVVAGDSVGSSNFENCVKSALDACRHLQTALARGVETGKAAL